MDSLQPWALTGLIFGPLFLASNVETSFALERPGHAATIFLTVVGSFLVLSSRILAHRFSHVSSDQAYTALPLDDIGTTTSPTPPSPRPSENTRAPPSKRLIRLALGALVIALCLRVDIIRRIVQNIECSHHGYTMLLPFLFAALESWTVQRDNATKHNNLDTNELDDSIYDTVERYWSTSRYRLVLPAALLSFSSALIQRFEPNPGSTYICPAVTLARHTVAVSSLLALPIDFCIIFCIHYILRASSSSSSSSSRKASVGRPLIAIGYALLAAAIITLVTGAIYFLLSPDDRPWMLSLPAGFLPSIVTISLLGCVVAWSACLCIHFYGAMIPVAIVVFSVTTLASTASSWRHVQPFPPASEGLAFLLYCCAIIGFTLLISGAAFTHTPPWFLALLVVPLTLRSIGWMAHTSYATFHPIDMLIYDAKHRHEQYVADAFSSTNLSAAVENYQARYKRHPPPGFERWYEYATTRNSTIIDDFDRINDDLLPYWSISPAEIRQRTWQAISNPWNDVAGISVRNGKADISPNVMPTHRWMLDGVVDMINKFGQWLPDMDLGFNLNDECRISVPHQAIESMRRMGRNSQHLDRPVQNKFSEGRAENWTAIPAEPIQETPFKEMSFQRTFSEFGKVGCPSGSRARKWRYWDNSHICTSCAAPHSMGAFLANWTLSADVCHQPDMANLHGLYLSPAAFKASHDLYPVFSQSKAPGYNDILYPSAWNYMDKVKYDPGEEHPDLDFEKKTRTLFWRGATSEGVSPGSGTWKGMSRQRFNHLANNINDTTPPQPVLLTYPFAPRGKLSYISMETGQLSKLVSTDVHIVDNILRCGGKDCVEQADEFAPLATPMDFQAHWSYKYLLDLDGAGFSGRFLPFLASRSLPFKAALFREWYDSRLTPWLHFVPLDLRGQGFWASLVYFAGLEGIINGKRVSMVAHDKEGGLIAEKGREWAGQVLRKEDMEIYFFRLLLEWGRLTDDGREGLGFSMPGEAASPVAA